jgi:hypothetical protein
VFGHQYCTERFCPKQYVALTWWVSRFTWLKTDQVQHSAGRQQTEVLCPLIFGLSWSFQMLAVALFLEKERIMHCIIFGKVVDT